MFHVKRWHIKTYINILLLYTLFKPLFIMKIGIYYASSTGNSKHLAEYIAKYIL